MNVGVEVAKYWVGTTIAKKRSLKLQIRNLFKYLGTLSINDVRKTVSNMYNADKIRSVLFRLTQIRMTRVAFLNILLTKQAVLKLKDILHLHIKEIAS